MTSLLATAALLLPAAWSAPALAHEAGHESGHGRKEAAGHSHEKCELHGGSVTMTPDNHFEVLFTSGGVRVYLYDDVQKPIRDPRGVKMSASLEARDGKTTPLALSYVAPDSARGHVQGYIRGDFDFSAVKPGTMKSNFTVDGLAGAPLTFRTPVSVALQAVYACPMHPDFRAEDPIPCPKCGMLMKRVGAAPAHHGT